MKRRILNILIALDQFLFCIFTLGHSKPIDTFSAAAWRLEQTGHWAGKLFRPAIDWMFRVFVRDKDHCRKAYENLMNGKYLPADIRAHQGGAHG